MTTTNTNSSARTLTIPNLVNGQIYRARVSAVNNYGQGPFANWIQVTPSEFSTDEYYYDNTLLMHFDNDGSDSFVDSSAYQKTITSYGNTILSNTQSKFGNSSSYFNGDTSYLRVASGPDFAFPSDFTIECWVYFTNSSRGYQGIIGAHSGSDQTGWVLYLETNNILTFNSGAGSGWTGAVSSGETITPNEWHHIAVSRSGSSLRIFIDGTLKGTITSNVNIASGSVIDIGDYTCLNQYGYNFTMSGYIDDLRITKGVARYVSNFSVPVAPAPNLGPASTVPSSPSNLTVSEDQGIVSLSWSRPSSPRVVDTRAPITYYGVEYSSDNGSSWTEHSVVSGGSLLTRSISGLPANTPYLFRVRAQNSVGFGPYSSTANISTLTNVPSGVSAIGDDSQAYVSWTAPTPNNSSIRDYGIQYSPDAGGSWYTYSHSPSIDTLINVTGLNNTSNYSFKVAAVNLAGTGIYSSDSSPITVAPRSDNLYNKTRILLHLDSN